MTAFRTAEKIASDALGRVGVFPVADQGPDPVQLSRALDALDKLVAQLAGTMRCLWLVRKTALLTLAPNVGDFDLIDASAGTITTGDVQFVIDVKLRYTPIGDDSGIERIDQRTWDAIPDKTASGAPDVVLIDRTVRRPRVYISPVPAVAGYQLLVAFQGYAADLTASKGNVDLGLEAAWQRWAEYATAADIGSGPVVRLPGSVIQDYRSQAEKAKAELIAFNNKAGIFPPRTRFWDGGAVGRRSSSRGYRRV